MDAREALELIQLANFIRERIADYRLYGRQMDPDNVNHLLVAAYFRGMIDADIPDEKRWKYIEEVMV